NRLLVWLDQAGGGAGAFHPGPRPASDRAELELTGYLALAPAGPRKTEPTLELPVLRLVSAESQQTTLRLSARPGLALRQLSLRQLGRVPDPRAPAWEQVLAARSAGYGGSFAVRPGPRPKVTVRTRVELRGRELHFTSSVERDAGRSEPGPLTVRLSCPGWLAGGEWSLVEE